MAKFSASGSIGNVYSTRGNRQLYKSCKNLPRCIFLQSLKELSKVEIYTDHSPGVFNSKLCSVLNIKKRNVVQRSDATML